MNAGGPVDVEDARRIAGRALARGRRNVTWVIVAGLVFAGGALGWLAIEIATAASLQRTGVHTSARVDDVYDGKSPQITVVYPASQVYVSIPLWFGTGDYRVGGRVEISYDRSDPSHAVIATGLPAPGGLKGAPLFLLLGGLVISAGCGYGRWRSRSLVRLLDTQPVLMSVSASALESSDDVEITLKLDGSIVSPLGRRPRKTWPPGVVSACVFGEVAAKSWIVVVVSERDAALIRRLSRTRSNQSGSGTQPSGIGCT